MDFLKTLTSQDNNNPVKFFIPDGWDSPKNINALGYTTIALCQQQTMAADLIRFNIANYTTTIVVVEGAVEEAFNAELKKQSALEGDFTSHTDGKWTPGTKEGATLPGNLVVALNPNAVKDFATVSSPDGKDSRVPATRPFPVEGSDVEVDSTYSRIVSYDPTGKHETLILLPKKLGKKELRSLEFSLENPVKGKKTKKKSKKKSKKTA